MGCYVLLMISTQLELKRYVWYRRVSSTNRGEKKKKRANAGLMRAGDARWQRFPWATASQDCNGTRVPKKIMKDDAA